jgi:hypothetical protein
MPFNSFSSGGGAAAAVNPNRTPYPIGLGAAGLGTAIVSGGSNAKGTYTTIGTAPAALYGGILNLSANGSTGQGVRGLLDVSFDAGVTTHIPNLALTIGNSGAARIDLTGFAIANAADIRLKLQASSAAFTVNAYLEGLERLAQDPPGYASATNILAVDTAATRVSSVDVALISTLATYTTLVADTGASAFAGLMASVQESTSTPATTQYWDVALAIGAAAAEAEISWWKAHASIGATSVPRGNMIPALQRTIPANSRISGRITAITPGSENGRFGLWGLVSA